MSDKKKHTLRNLIIGIISSVIGGIILILIPSFRNIFLKLLRWIWSGVVWVWTFICTSHSLPGWILIILFLLAFVGIKKIFLELKTDKEYKHYTEDIIQNVKWRWSWKGKEISDISPFCQSCDNQLVLKYDHINYKIDFICERCNKVVATITDANMYGEFDPVKREISRKIRTGDFKKL
jgi:hypothetical protein